MEKKDGANLFIFFYFKNFTSLIRILMAFERGSTSFDRIPDFLKRSRCVDAEKTPLLNTTKQIFSSLSDTFDAARRMYEDADAIEVIKTTNGSKLPTTAPWIRRGAPAQIHFVPNSRPVTNRSGIKQMLEKRLAEREEKKPQKRAARRKPAPAKRRRASASEDEEDGTSLDEEDSEISEEEDEITSGDERFIDNGDEEEEDSDSEYTEGEAEFSNDEEESSEEDETALSGVEDDDDTESEYVSSNKLRQRERQIVAESAAIMQINRRMRPILTTVDTRLYNIVVCLFWATRQPLDRDVTPLTEAIPTALECIMTNRFLPESNTSIGACYVWLINHGKLRRNLMDNYESKQLEAWLSAIQHSDTLDDTPTFVYLPKKTKYCFLSGEPCRTGVQLLDVTTKEPMATLWFDATNVKTNAWVLNLTRFLFLPATLSQFCSLNLSSSARQLSDDDMQTAYNWITALTEEIGHFLFEEGVTPGATAMLDKELTRNYVN